MNQSYPLSWPVGLSRTRPGTRTAGPFQMPAGRVRQLLTRELELLGATNIVVSTNVAVRRDGLPYANQTKLDDPGVALYFTRKGEDVAFACDRWLSVDANLRAIGMTIEAIRGIERWGTGEMVDRAFRGYKALPESGSPSRDHRAWHEVLEVSPTASPEIIRAAFRSKAAKAHPDAGGSVEAFNEVQEAYKLGLSQGAGDAQA